MRRGSPEPDQVAAIPVRRWGVPKGFIDGDDTPEQAALTEAREEAGLIGRIDSQAVGSYEYSKLGDRLLVEVYLMHVLEELPVWDEMDVRERHWTTLAEAGRLLERHPIRALWNAICSHAK